MQVYRCGWQKEKEVGRPTGMIDRVEKGVESDASCGVVSPSLRSTERKRERERVVSSYLYVKAGLPMPLHIYI